MWKQSGRSAALERAQTLLSSRRGRAAPVAASLYAPRVLSDLSDNESSLSLGPAQVNQAGATPVPNQTDDEGPEVARPLTPLDSWAIRFLKRPSATAQDQPKERVVASSLRGSQAAVLNRLAQIENRFGKSLHTTGFSRAGKTAVQELTEEQGVLPSTDQPSTDQPSTDQPSTDQPSMAQPRRFVKSRTGAHGRPSEDSNSKRQLHTEIPPTPLPPTSLRHTSIVQTQSNFSTPSMSPSPPCLPPSAPTLSPSSHSLSSGGSVSYACGNVCSLEELFPLEAASEDAQSDCSDSSECFRLNLIDLDELANTALLLEEHPSAQEQKLQEEPQEEVPDEVDVPDKVEVVDQVEEVEEVLEDYPSDFESVVQTDSLSEHSQGSGQPPSPCSKSSYSNTFSRASEPCTPEPQPHSHGSLLHGHVPLPHSYAPLPQPDMTSAKACRDTAGQASHVPATGCSSCPARELLMQSLRQQLTLTSHFISSSQEHRARVLEGLGPPNYRYTTLQDTLKYISTLGASRPHSDQQTVRK